MQPRGDRSGPPLHHGIGWRTALYTVTPVATPRAIAADAELSIAWRCVADCRLLIADRFRRQALPPPAQRFTPLTSPVARLCPQTPLRSCTQSNMAGESSTVVATRQTAGSTCMPSSHSAMASFRFEPHCQLRPAAGEGRGGAFARKVQGSALLPVLHSHVRSRLDQQPNALRVAVVAGPVQGGEPKLQSTAAHTRRRGPVVKTSLRANVDSQRGPRLESSQEGQFCVVTALGSSAQRERRL